MGGGSVRETSPTGAKKSSLGVNTEQNLAMIRALIKKTNTVPREKVRYTPPPYEPRKKPGSGEGALYYPGGGAESTETQSITGPTDYGPMTEAQRSTVANVTGGPYGWGVEAGLWGGKPSVESEKSAEDTSEKSAEKTTDLGAMAAGSIGRTAIDAALGQIAGTTVSPMGALGLMGLGVLGLDKPSVRNTLGLSPEVGIYGPSAVDQQAMADRMGYGMPGAPGGLVGGADMGGWSASTVGGLGGSFGTAPGDERDGGAPDGGQSDTSGTADSTGGSRGSDGPDRAKGGVDYATTPRTTRWGEKSTGGETAIFIPEKYNKPGVQDPQELRIQQGLIRSLSQIMK